MNRRERRRHAKELQRLTQQQPQISQIPQVPVPQTAAAGRTQRVTLQQTFHQGPLPPAAELQGIEQACPGGADRVIRMAERQADHRQDLENRVTNSNIDREKDGQRIGAGLFVFVVLVGAFLTMQGFSTAGLGAIITAAGSAAGIFIFGRAKRQKDLDQKKQ